MYKDFIHIFVLSCTKATYLIEKRLHRKLNFIEAFQLRLHLSICSYCSDYRVKAELIDALMKASVNDSGNSSVFTPAEVDKLKERVCDKLFR